MSVSTSPSASPKRKADGNSLTVRFAPLQPSHTFKRSKTSLPTGKEDDNVSDKVKFNHDADQQRDETVTNYHRPENFPDFTIPDEIRTMLMIPSRKDNHQRGETVNTDHQPDNTADYTVDTDQQAIPPVSDPDYLKKLKIKVMDATDTIPDSMMEVDYHETVAGLRKVIIHRFLKEVELHPSRIRLIFNSDSVRASTSRQLPGHSLISEEVELGDEFGDDPAFEDGVNLKVEVQILPRLK